MGKRWGTDPNIWGDVGKLFMPRLLASPRLDSTRAIAPSQQPVWLPQPAWRLPARDLPPTIGRILLAHRSPTAHRQPLAACY